MRMCIPGAAALTCSRCSLDDAGDALQAVDLIARYAAHRPDEPWILGAGWSQDWFPGAASPRRCSTRSSPIGRSFSTTGMVTVRGEQRRLRGAGIDAMTPDPRDGRIERNPDGTPQGTLHEGAANMMQEAAPPDTFDDLRRGILAGQKYLLSNGITAWQDAHVDQVTHDAYRSLAGSGELSDAWSGALVEPT